MNSLWQERLVAHPMRFVVDRLLPVSVEDRRRAIAAFGLYAVFMSSYYVFKPVRGSLYLHYLGADNLPYAYVGSMGLAFVAMAGYNRLFLAVNPRRLFNVVVDMLAGSALLFWVIRAMGLISPGLFSFLFFLWVSLYGALATALFWSVANNNFDPEAGRRVYGFIGAGGVLGAFCGGLLTKLLLGYGLVGTEELLLVGTGLLIVTLPLMQWVRGLPILYRAPVIPKNPVGLDSPDEKDGLYWITRDRYVSSIALLVLLTTLSGTILDLQYNRVVEHNLIDKDAKTAFFGQLYASVNIVGFIIQLTLTSWIHRRFGPTPGLLILPVVAMTGAVVLLAPDLNTVTVVWVLCLATMYSIHQASKELLYLPTPPSVRIGAKGYIDVFVFRAGDAGASMLALLWKRIAGPASETLGVLVFALAPLAGVVVLILGRAHRRKVDRSRQASAVGRLPAEEPVRAPLSRAEDVVA